MKMAPVAEIKSKFSEYVNECRNGAVIVTKNGRPTAALISIDSEDELERIIISNSKIFKEIIEGAKRRIKNKKYSSHKDFWADMKKK